MASPLFSLARSMNPSRWRNANIGLQALCSLGSRRTIIEPVTAPKPSPHRMEENTFMTLEADPTKHSQKHESRIYLLPHSTYEKLFALGGWERQHTLNHKTFREVPVIIRRPALELMDLIKNQDFTKPSVRYILYGRYGSGKTHIINHLIHYAHSAGFLIMHLPSPTTFLAAWNAELLPSQSRPGRVDMPVQSTLWLQHFRSQNARILTDLDLKASRRYEWSVREVTEEGDSLISILEHGINRTRHASDCAAVIMKEIKEQSASGKFKVFVAADYINAYYAFHNFSTMRHPDTRRIRIDEITVVRAFKKFLLNDWKFGTIVGAVDNRNADHYIPFHTPRLLLGIEGWNAIDPFIPIEVPFYDDTEMTSMLDYYTDRKWLLQPQSHTRQGREELIFLSGYSPYELDKLAESR